MLTRVAPWAAAGGRGAVRFRAGLRVPGRAARAGRGRLSDPLKVHQAGRKQVPAQLAGALTRVAPWAAAGGRGAVRLRAGLRVPGRGARAGGAPLRGQRRRRPARPLRAPVGAAALQPARHRGPRWQLLSLLRNAGTEHWVCILSMPPCVHRPCWAGLNCRNVFLHDMGSLGTTP